MISFFASNDVEIRRTDTSIGSRVSALDRDPAQTPGYLRPESVHTWLDPRQVDALKEFFMKERDELLRRWRSAAYPYMICNEHDDGIFVTDERDGRQLLVRRGDEYTALPEYTEAARAYFEAHPEPKPWDGAKPDEIWAVTLHGVERPCRVLNPQYSEHELAFLPLNEVSPTWFVPSASVTAARKIWPKEDS